MTIGDFFDTLSSLRLKKAEAATYFTGNERAHTSKLAKKHTPAWRLLIGATVGAIYAVCMFFPQVRALYTVMAKIVVSFILAAITFSIKKWRTFIKTVGIFYITSFIFGGVSLGIFYFTGAGKGTIISNGIFYYNMPLRLLIVSSAIAYAAIRLIWRIYKSDRIREYKRIEIRFMGNTVRLNALIDTGNMLCEPITGTPVIVGEFDKLKPILPDEFNDIYKSNAPEEIICNIKDDYLTERLRVIPYSSLGNTNGLLIGFKPDSVLIENHLCKSIIICIYNRQLSQSRDYDALLNPEIISAM